MVSFLLLTAIVSCTVAKVIPISRGDGLAFRGVQVVNPTIPGLEINLFIHDDLVLVPKYLNKYNVRFMLSSPREGFDGESVYKLERVHIRTKAGTKDDEPDSLNQLEFVHVRTDKKLEPLLLDTEFAKMIEDRKVLIGTHSLGFKLLEPANEEVVEEPKEEDLNLNLMPEWNSRWKFKEKGDKFKVAIVKRLDRKEQTIVFSDGFSWHGTFTLSLTEFIEGLESGSIKPAKEIVKGPTIDYLTINKDNAMDAEYDDHVDSNYDQYEDDDVPDQMKRVQNILRDLRRKKARNIID